MVALPGITVLEVSRTRAGAYAGKLLVDAGAEVLRLPADVTGEAMPPAARGYMHRGKHEVPVAAVLDRDAPGSIAGRLAVVVTDLPAGTLTQLGLDWPATSAIDGLIYVHLRPVPRRQVPSYPDASELTMQALSGFMYMTGYPDREPLAVPYGLAHVQLGLHGAGAAMAALVRRLSTGAGSHVEISGNEVLAAYVRIYGGVARHYGIPLRRAGRRAPGSGGRYPMSLFRVSDGYIVMIVRSSREWESFVSMIGAPAWTAEPRYRDLTAMAMKYPDEVDELLVPWLMKQTRAGIVEMAHRYALPVAPVCTVEEVLADEQMRSRGFFDTVVVGEDSVDLPGRPWQAGRHIAR